MSPARRALRADLTRLGEHPIPGPSLAFTARLERHLLGGIDEHGDATVIAMPNRPRRFVPMLTGAAATIVAVVLAAALFGVFDHGGTGRLQLAGAVKNTTVVLPGGRTVPGHSGLGLPNGAVVRTGPNGQASAGAVQLGPGLEGVVNDGSIKIQLPPVSLPVHLPPVTIPTIPTIPTVPGTPGGLSLPR